MQILIVGAGAIGAYLGACLGRSGQLVTLVGRQRFVDAVNGQAPGVHVELPEGRAWQTTNFRAVVSLKEATLSAGLYEPPYDAILVCVKAYDVDEVILELQACRQGLMDPSSTHISKPIILSFQNGVGSEERLVQAFGEDMVWAATTTTPVTTPAAGTVRVERKGGVICLAPMLALQDERQPFADLEDSSIVRALREAFMAPHIYDNARALKWSKLLLNMLGNASSAILGLHPATLYADKRLFRFERQALEEALRVMRTLGIQPLNFPHYPARLLAVAVRVLPDNLLQPILRRQLSRGRGGKWPSLNYDVVRQTGKSEVQWLNGAVVRYGQQLGIPTPVNARLTDVLMRIIHHEDDPSTWHGHIDKLISI